MTFTRANPPCRARLRTRGADARLADRVAGEVEELGEPAERPPDRARQELPDPGDVLVVGGARDAELDELLGQERVVDAVEEQVDRDRDDDEVVEAAEDRDRVGHDVAGEEHVAERAGEERLARRRDPVVEDERPEQAGVERGATGERQEREQADDPADRCAAALPVPGEPRSGAGRTEP